MDVEGRVTQGVVAEESEEALSGWHYITNAQRDDIQARASGLMLPRILRDCLFALAVRG